MADKIIYHLLSDTCKALSHPIRIEIIELLGKGELGFSEISERTGVAKSNLSQHLSVMVERGILRQRKEGLNSYFRLSSQKVTEACQLIREVLIERLEKTQEILKTF